MKACAQTWSDFDVVTMTNLDVCDLIIWLWNQSPWIVLPYGLYYLGFGGRELNKDQKIYCKVSHWPSLLFPILLFFFLFIGNNKIVLSEEQQSSSTDSVIYIYMYSVHKHHCHLFTWSDSSNPCSHHKIINSKAKPLWLIHKNRHIDSSREKMSTLSPENIVQNPKP